MSSTSCQRIRGKWTIGSMTRRSRPAATSYTIGFSSRWIASATHSGHTDGGIAVGVRLGNRSTRVVLREEDRRDSLFRQRVRTDNIQIIVKNGRRLFRCIEFLERVSREGSDKTPRVDWFREILYTSRVFRLLNGLRQGMRAHCDDRYVA